MKLRLAGEQPNVGLLGVTSHPFLRRYPMHSTTITRVQDFLRGLQALCNTHRIAVYGDMLVTIPEANRFVVQELNELEACPTFALCSGPRPGDTIHAEFVLTLRTDRPAPGNGARCHDRLFSLAAKYF